MIVENPLTGKVVGEIPDQEYNAILLSSRLLDRDALIDRMQQEKRKSTPRYMVFFTELIRTNLERI